jgi:hypothetical protein
MTYGIYIIRFDVLTRRSNMSASSSSKQERSEDGRSEISPFSAAHAQHTNNRCKSQLAEPSGCVVRGRSATSPRLCGSGFSGRGAAGKTSLHLSSFGSRTVSSSTTLMMMMVMMMISCAAAGRGVSLRKSGLCISRYTVDVSLRKPGLCTSRNTRSDL